MTLTPAVVLDVWERASATGPVARPLVLLSAADPALDADRAGAEPLGRRDVRLGAVRRALVGPEVVATAACPSCAEPVEMRFDVDDVWAVPVGGSDGLDPVADERTVVLDGYEVVCRPLSTADLLAVADADSASRPAALFARSVRSARHRGIPVAAAALPTHVQAAVEAALADADPLADVVLALTCPGCGTSWSAPVDLGAFLWEELDHAARRLLDEVDLLARAYGWREPDILALSPWRRHRYLELAQA